MRSSRISHHYLTETLLVPPKHSQTIKILFAFLVIHARCQYTNWQVTSTISQQRLFADPSAFYPTPCASHKTSGSGDRPLWHKVAAKIFTESSLIDGRMSVTCAHMRNTCTLLPCHLLPLQYATSARTAFHSAQKGADTLVSPLPHATAADRDVAAHLPCSRMSQVMYMHIYMPCCKTLS